jgi:hypothetical protein
MTEKTALEKQRDNYTKIPEYVFKQYADGLLSNTATAEDRMKWLEISIDPRLPVDVMDDNTGEVLFRVPPLTYTTNVLTGRNISGLVSEWVMRSEISPFHGNEFAAKNVTPDMVIGEAPDSDVEAWRNILERYGYIANSSGVSAVDSGAITDDPDSW